MNPYVVYAWMAVVLAIAIWSQVAFGRYVRMYRSILDPTVPEYGWLGPTLWHLMKDFGMAERIHKSINERQESPRLEGARRTYRLSRRLLRAVGLGGVISLVLMRLFGG